MEQKNNFHLLMILINLFCGNFFFAFRLGAATRGGVINSYHSMNGRQGALLFLTTEAPSTSDIN